MMAKGNREMGEGTTTYAKRS